MFQTVPLSIIRSFALYTQQWYMSYILRAGSGRSVLILLASCQQTCMTYTIGVCTVKNWWWANELSETCRVLFQKYIWEISASGWFYYKNTTRLNANICCKFLPTSLVFHRCCLISFCLSSYLTDTLFPSACHKNSCCFLCLRNRILS